MEDHQEDSEEEGFMGGDTYSAQAPEVIPSEDVQLLFNRPRTLIPRGNKPSLRHSDFIRARLPSSAVSKWGTTVSEIDGGNHPVGEGWPR